MDTVGERTARDTVEERVTRVFAEAGATVRLHAVDLHSDREVGVAADEQVVLASVFKILLVLEFARQAGAGQIDPRERVVLTAADRLGGWGVAGCADDVTMSLRDLAYFTMSVSDNTAADALLRRVGPDTVRLLAAELGLGRTRVLGGPRELLESMFEDAGAADAAEFAELYPGLEPRRVRGFAALDPARTTSGTARDVTTLLRLVWQDRAGPAAACAWVRELMSRQAFRHRLASGFPDDVRVAAKTGTLPGHHIEAGVVHYPDGGRYAVAVFAGTVGLAPFQVAVDRAIGRAARVAVEGLRAAPGA
ncbi:serine hydrolase [Streptomyces sp. NRRL F-5123]|uniref:serine hydrolase n=1 Tax=Streptomyces sp. NRRL F-5123 TaxID=1463856 RepID=UPI000694D63E|nr:serine hydrolase [Streptomyces sp. NRRL F-5123]